MQSKQTLLWAALLAVLLLPRVAQAYGEPVNGFPSWYERVILVFTNEARSDPQAALDGCALSVCEEKACYDSALPPLQWHEGLAKLARFHAQNLVQTNCGMSHTSPCQLVSNIAALYPSSCDGAQSCACQGAVSCGAGTGTWDRFALFGISGGARAENIAGYGDPWSIFRQWLWEDSSSGTTCAWSMSNGHRWSILNASYQRLGVGAYSGSNRRYTVQDFQSGSLSEKIPGGAHYPESGPTVEFIANWYHSSAPVKAMVNVGGTCQALSLYRGSGSNGSYRSSQNVGTSCVRYYFIFEDGAGNVYEHPTTGSFGINCAEDWSASRPAAGAGCSCTPDCSGKACGDDGCGGSCGTCGVHSSCNSGQCVCDFVSCGASCCASGASCVGGVCCLPDCTGKSCGDDGCGGSCGSCGSTQLCSAGACVCATGLSACSGSCVDTNTDENHCGGCGQSCAPDEQCMSGVCARSCAPGLTDCGAGCVDLMTDTEHCGGCGLACPSGNSCVGGSCALGCLAGLVVCEGTCVDLRTDRANCGGCGIECGSGELCADGSCESLCTDGLTRCGLYCVDLESSAQHCGMCDAPCAAREQCEQGSCVCRSGYVACGDACVDVMVDPEHCGACGQLCAGDEQCEGGVCVLSCSSGLTACMRSCVELQSSSEHCGMCGLACEVAQRCEAGRCVGDCAEGLVLCDGACVDLETDDAHCGACGQACGGWSRCEAGECVVQSEDGEPVEAIEDEALEPVEAIETAESIEALEDEVLEPGLDVEADGGQSEESAVQSSSCACRQGRDAAPLQGMWLLLVGALAMLLRCRRRAGSGS